MNKKTLIKFYDTELKKEKFGIVKEDLSHKILVYRITLANPPYGLRSTLPITIHHSDVLNEFGCVDYNTFIRSHPEWII